MGDSDETASAAPSSSAASQAQFLAQYLATTFFEKTLPGNSLKDG